MRLKKMLACLSAVAMLGSLAAMQVSAAETDAVVLGDVNGDGVVDGSDAAAILGYDAAVLSSGEDAFLAAKAWFSLDAADVNSDGTINAIDSSICMQYDAAIGAQLTDETFVVFATGFTKAVTVNEEATATEVTVMLGDTNSDGAINKTDAANYLDYYTALTLDSLDDADYDFFALAEADINGDGVVNLLEASIILGYDTCEAAYFFTDLSLAEFVASEFYDEAYYEQCVAEYLEWFNGLTQEEIDELFR